MAIAAPQGVTTSGLPPYGDAATNVLSGVFTASGPGDAISILGPMNLLIYASINTTLTTTNASTAASVGSGTGLAAGVAINSKNVPPGTTWATFSGTSGTLAFPAYFLTGYLNTTNGQVMGLASTAYLLGASVTVVSPTASGVTLASGTTVTGIVQAAVAPTSNPPSPGVQGIIQLSATPSAVGPLNAPVLLRFALTSNAVTTGADTAAIFTGVGVTWSGTVQLERSFDGGSTWLICNVGGSGTLAQYTAGTPVSATFGEPERFVAYRVNCPNYTSGTINYRISTTGAAALSLAINQLS